MERRNQIQITFEFTTNLFVLFASNLLSYAIFTTVVKKIENYSLEAWTEYAIIVLLSYITAFFCFASPINLHKRSRAMEISATFKGCLMTYALLSILLLLTKNDIIQSRYLWISSLYSYCTGSIIARYVLKKILLKRIPGSRLATMTGVITTTDIGKAFIPELKKDWSKNIKAVALVDTSFEKDNYVTSSGEIMSEIDGVPIVANKDNLMGWVRTSALDEVFINLPAGNEAIVANYIEELEDMGITVKVNIPTLEKILNESKFDNLKCEIHSATPIATFSPVVHSQTALVFKSMLDFVGGIAGCLISLPIILLVAIPLKIESPGPLIFKQQRIGKNGRVFNIYKLRSMYIDAEERKKALMEQNQMDGLMFKMDNDPRITKIGKFIRKTSIDELPQFWNVIKGDMSLVGTRPPTIDEFEQYESHHKRRLSLKPGITGLWQVSGRSNIQNFEEVVRLDCEYIDNWSFFLDIEILLKTVTTVLTHNGAE